MVRVQNVMPVFTIMAAALVFGVVGQPAFASSPEHKPPLPRDSYVLFQSDLSYAEVSASYAWSIYNNVRQILSEFLSIDGNFFYDADKRNDISESLKNFRNILINLHCEVRRDSSTAVLFIQIDRHDTAESLFNFVTSAPFFQPASLLDSFAATFPEAFSMPVMRKYSYNIPTSGFQVPKGAPSYAMPSAGLDPADLLNLGLTFGDVIYYRHVTDLEIDLAASDAVPSRVIQSVELFSARRGLESVVGGFSGLVAVGTLLAAMVMLDGMRDNPSAPAPPAWLWVTFGAATLTCGSVALELSAFPPRVTTVLNDWCFSERKSASVRGNGH